MYYLVYRNIHTNIEVGVPHDNVALPLLVGVHGIVTWCINAWAVENGGEEMARFSQISSIGVCLYNSYQLPAIYLVNIQQPYSVEVV